MDENEKKRLMRLRNNRSFNRQNSHKHNRVPSSWRRARGKHSAVRKGENHAQPMPDVGYRSPAAVRNLHPSGLNDVLVERPDDLAELDPDADAARIASGVGGRKREQILERADHLDIHVLNPGNGE
jgi:large subunit ribosomal protein L32e